MVFRRSLALSIALSTALVLVACDSSQPAPAPVVPPAAEQRRSEETPKAIELVPVAATPEVAVADEPTTATETVAPAEAPVATVAPVPPLGGMEAGMSITHSHGAAALHTHGERLEVGTQTFEAYVINVFQDGKVKAGKDLGIDCFVTGVGSLKAVTAWIGRPDGERGPVAEMPPEGANNYHNHVVAPDTLPAESKLCIRLEMTDGRAKVLVFDVAIEQ